MIPIFTRILAVFIGGYAATVGLVALSSVLLILLVGMSKSEALVLTSMIGFLTYAAIVIWGWAERSQQRLWLGVGGAALASNLSAIGLARLLPVVTGGG